jgi:hypothetical protein
MKHPRLWHPASLYLLHPYSRVRSRMQGVVGAEGLRPPVTRLGARLQRQSNMGFLLLLSTLKAKN